MSKETLSKKKGLAVTLLSFVVPSIVSLAIGFLVGNIYTALSFVTISTGLFFGVSLRFVRKRTFLVVERFGYFWDIKFAGPRLIIPWIDNIVLEENFLQKSVELFKDISIDFIGGSAPILSDGWYQIGNPTDIDADNWNAVKDNVLKYTYRVRAEDRAARIADIFQGAFRTFLEQLNIPDAQKQMEALAMAGTEAARGALEEIGVYPFPGKGIIVRDIVLPPVIITLREQVLRGEMDAQEAVNRARMYWAPLTEMKKGMDAAGMKMSDDEIRQLFLAQKGFETLQKTGSNVSLIGSDIDNVQKVISVGTAGLKGGKTL